MSGYTSGRRDAWREFAADRDLLLWLHAEALWIARLESDNADQWCADLERVEEDNARLRLENSRLRREVEFEANGEVPRVDGLSLPVCACAIDASKLDLTRWAVCQCAVHPEGGTA